MRRAQRARQVPRAWLALALVLGAAGRAAAEPAPDARAARTEPSPDAPARATSEDERVVALNEEGSALYAAGDYRHAAERFLHAYAIDADPNLLFNIASCYEGLGDIDAAIEKYRAFLSAPAADPDGKPRAEQAIERLLGEREPTAPPVSTAPVATAPVAAPPAPPPPALPSEPAPRDPAWLPWVGVGGGAALGVLGASVYWLGVADHDEVTSAPGYGDPNAIAAMTRARADALVRSGNTKKAIGVTTAAVGGGLLAGYFVWWLLDPRAEPPGAGRLDVTLGAATARVSLTGRF